MTKVKNFVGILLVFVFLLMGIVKTTAAEQNGGEEFTPRTYNTLKDCIDKAGGDAAKEKACQSAFISVGEPTGALTDINKILSSGIQLILIVAGLIAFVYLLLGGIKWITSGGDKGQVEAARGQIIQALIGLIVVLAAWGLITLVEQIADVGLGFSKPMKIPTFYTPK